MNTFKQGDRVRVNKPDNWNQGKQATVKSHFPNGMVNVIFDASPRDHVSAVWHEDLDHILTDEQEIQKIVEALKKVIPDWTEDQYRETAQGVYENGLRYDQKAARA